MDDLGLRCHSTHNHIESFTPGDTMGKVIELKVKIVFGHRSVVPASGISALALAHAARSG